MADVGFSSKWIFLLKLKGVRRFSILQDNLWYQTMYWMHKIYMVETAESYLGNSGSWYLSSMYLFSCPADDL